LKQEILALCKTMEPKFISMRRALHRIPEPSFEEHKTRAKVCSFLKAARIPYKLSRRSTGVVGLVKGSHGRTIALRADMDALNITERTGLKFASRNKGFMHACGHDAHMAMVLGAGMVLKRLGRGLPGQVKLIFQPAEESPPGGALALIKEGVLKSPRVNAVLGIHVAPSVESGKIAFNTGAISASGDDFLITITGKAGHGSSPHKAVDAIVAAAYFITALQTVVSRRVSALDNVVVSIGRIRGGERDNIIAETVEMEGTIRTKSNRLRRQVPAMMKTVLHSTCSAFGAKGKFKYIEGYPPIITDEDFSNLVWEACGEILGKARLTKTLELKMGAEDFARYASEVPGTMIFAGVGRKKGETHELHHPEFDIDENVLKTGVAALAHSAYRFLSENGRGRGGKGK
jgi:amidohydrolase